MSENVLRIASVNVPGHWCKNAFHAGEKHCALGHISEASGVRDMSGEEIQASSVIQNNKVARRILAGVIAEQFPERLRMELTDDEFNVGAVIMEFNDHPKTAEAEVEAVFEKAAVKWEETR